MKRVVQILLLAAAMFAGATGARASSLWPESLPKQPLLYVIHGYLDRAPEGTKILDRIDISANDHRRTLLVTWYGTPGETTLDRHLSRSMAQPYGIRGPAELVEHMGSAPAGTLIEGKFAVYESGPPWLLIGELDFPDAQHSNKNPPSIQP